MSIRTFVGRSYSFFPDLVNDACHSLNILSTDLNFINLSVFQRLGNLKNLKKGKPVLQKGSLNIFIVVIYISPNKLVFFPWTSAKQMFTNLCPFSNLALQLCLQHHSRFQTHKKSSTKNPCKFAVRETFNCFQCLWGFWGVFLLRHFLVLSTLFISLFPFYSTCRLLPCPYYYPLMHFESCQRCLLYIWKVQARFFYVSSSSSVLFLLLVLKTFPCCDS